MNTVPVYIKRGATHRLIGYAFSKPIVPSIFAMDMANEFHHNRAKELAKHARLAHPNRVQSHAY